VLLSHRLARLLEFLDEMFQAGGGAARGSGGLRVSARGDGASVGGELQMRGWGEEESGWGLVGGEDGDGE
jgi:hypothetical protein